MNFLLIHSPLVSSISMRLLSDEIQSRGHDTTLPTLSGSTNSEHIDELRELLVRKTSPCICVAHSGAGIYLSAIDPSLIDGYIFLDAIFSNSTASRFDLFDDANSVAAWRLIAEKNDGAIPASFVAKFGSLLENSETRTNFVASVCDVQITLYEEAVACHPQWSDARPGLFLQWTPTYEPDAQRAKNAGFEVIEQHRNHFELMNNPANLAEQCLKWCRMTCS